MLTSGFRKGANLREWDPYQERTFPTVDPHLDPQALSAPPYCATANLKENRRNLGQSR